MSDSGSTQSVYDACSLRRGHLCGCRVSVHVKILWSTLSLMVTAGCTFSLTQPFWVVHPETREALGLYGYCVRDTRISARPHTCAVHGGFLHLSHLPSNAWQVAFVLFAGGCVLVCVGSVASVVCFCLPRLCSGRLALRTGYVQTTAALVLIAAIFVFPVGLDSKLARHYCPGARMYNCGACHVGWAYVLGVMCASLSVFCPFLSQYIDFYEDSAAPLTV